MSTSSLFFVHRTFLFLWKELESRDETYLMVHDPLCQTFFLWFCPSLWTHKNTSIWIWLISSMKKISQSYSSASTKDIRQIWAGGRSFLFFITFKFLKWAGVFYRLNQSNTSKTDWNEAITNFQIVFRIWCGKKCSRLRIKKEKILVQLSLHMYFWVAH